MSKPPPKRRRTRKGASCRALGPPTANAAACNQHTHTCNAPAAAAVAAAAAGRPLRPTDLPTVKNCPPACLALAPSPPSQAAAALQLVARRLGRGSASVCPLSCGASWPQRVNMELAPSALRAPGAALARPHSSRRGSSSWPQQYCLHGLTRNIPCSVVGRALVYHTRLLLECRSAFLAIPHICSRSAVCSLHLAWVQHRARAQSALRS